MSGVVFIGYLLLAAGAPLVLWCSFVANKSFLVLLALASAFYWLLTLFAVSLVFRVFVPLPEHAGLFGLVLLVAVVLQEGARYGAFTIHRTIVHQLHAASTHLQLPKPTLSDRRLMAMTHGMGHAIAQTVFLYFSWIQLSTGKGTLYLDACPEMSFFLAAGLLSLAFFVLHTFSMVVAFHGFEKGSMPLVGAVGGWHLLAAFTTLFNMIQGGCVPATSLVLAEAVTAAAVAAAICWVHPREDEDSQHLASSSASARNAEGL